MKKVVLFVAFLGIAALAKSQNLTDVWTVKPYVGVNLSSLTKFPEAQEGKLKVGLVVGADVELRAMKWLGVSLGANYSVQGNRYNKAFYTSMPEHLYDPKEDLILHPSDPSIKFLGSQSSYQISLEYIICLSILHCMPVCKWVFLHVQNKLILMVKPIKMKHAISPQSSNASIFLFR